MVVDYIIVGAGITGLSLLLLLQEAKLPLSSVAIVDPHFDGGDLARRWTSVLSNTPWSKTYDHLVSACPSLPLSRFQREDPEQTTPLSTIAALLRQAAADALRAARKVQGVATRADYSSATGFWSVACSAGGAEQLLQGRRLLLAPGAEPRAMDLPIPSIPLEIGLQGGERLRAYVGRGQRVLQFGTMHSGTLVMRNLVRDCSASVVALYNTPTPFAWDRDGAYDGIKAEAADIADAVQRGDYKDSITLMPVADTSGVIRASAEADWVVYAMGFTPRLLPLFVDGEAKSAKVYDGATGALTEVPAAWGFGVAYPNRAPDGVHWDVSVAAFLLHMKAQLPAILGF